MKRLAKIFVFVFLALVVLIGALVIVLSTLDTKKLVASVFEIVEKEMFLKVNYEYKEKSFWELLGGVELENLEVLDSTKKDRKLLLKVGKVIVQFDLFSLLFSGDPSVYIYCKNVMPQVEAISEYLSSPEVKNKLSSGSGESGSKQSIPLRFIKLENVVISLAGRVISADVAFEGFPKLKVWGYINTTKTKFSFDSGKLEADRLIWDTIEVKDIFAIFDENFSKGEGKIKKISYGVFSANGIDFHIDVVKSFEIFAKISEISFPKQDISLSNVFVSLSPKAKIIVIKAFNEKTIAKVFLSDLIQVDVRINNLNFRDLPKGIIGLVSNFVKGGVVGGSLNVFVGNDIGVKGVLNASIENVLSSSLFSIIPVTLEFKGRELKCVSFLSDGRSDLKVSLVANWGLATNFSISLGEIRLDSKNFYVSSLSLPSQGSGKNEKADKSFSLKDLEFLVIDNTPFYLSISNLHIREKLPEVQNVFIKGILRKDKEIVLKYSVSGFLFRELEVKGNGEFGFGEGFRGIASLLPAKFSLGKIYKNLSLFEYLGGEVYGNAYLDDFKVEVGEEFVVSSRVKVEKMELVGIRLQSEVTKLINLDLSHIFIDSGVIDLTYRGNNVLARGNLVGDVETEFNLSMKIPMSEGSKVLTEVEFSYLKVDRSFIDNLPKIFFVAREINGIKYNLDEKYITFDRFKVRF